MRFVTSTLVVAPHLGTLTALVGTLRELTMRRGRVHVAVLDDPPPGVDVSVFAGTFRRLTFGRLPPLDRWAQLSATVRGVLDCWRFLDSSSDPRAFERALAEAPPLAARLASNRWLRSSLVRPAAARLLRLIHTAIPSSPPVIEFLQAYRPAILIVPSMFAVGSIVSDYLRAANELGIPTVALPERWDDIDARAWPHVMPDCIAMWNREQRRRAVDILGVPARRTAILGACLPLDIAGAVATTRESFGQRHGLDSSRAVVLLAVGHAEATRNTVVRQCIDRLRASADPRVRDAAVLVYWPPPTGVQQREHPELAAAVIPRPDTDPESYQSEIAEALVHADVVIADNMSLVLEAAARARPLVALITGDPDQKLARFCAAVSEREWPCVAGGLAALEPAVATLLRDGLDRTRQGAALTIVRPHGPDLLPGFLMHVRLLNEVRDRLAAPRVIPRWVPPLRVVIAPIASWAARRAARLPRHRESREQVRILIGAPSASSLSLYRPVLRALAERGHQLALVFTARRSQDADAYERIRCDVPNVVRAGVLPPPTGMWADISQGLLGLSAYLSMLDQRKPGTVPQWLVELALTLLPAGARPIARVARQTHGLPVRLRRVAARFDRATSASQASHDLLAQHAPDAVLSLPDSDLVIACESAAAQADLIHAASSRGIPCVSIAAGPDAQLHATVLQQRPSKLLVSDEGQRASVVRDLAVREDDVVAIGAASLDRCLNEPPLMNEDEFRDALGLPRDRPFVFFCGSIGVLSDPRREVDLLRRWVTSLRDSPDPILRDLPLLIRRPVRSSRWQTLDFSGLGPVVVGPRRYEKSGELDVVLLADSVRYAAAVVGIDGLSLMMAAAMGKPAIAISRADGSATDETPLEFLWKTKGSSVSHAASLDELTRQVRSAVTLTAPASPIATAFGERLAAGRDGRRSGDLAADVVERVARRADGRTDARAGLGAVLLRVPLLVIAGAVQVIGRLPLLRRR
jgi:hypothetical protein